MNIYAVKIFDISQEKLDELCSFLNLEKRNKIKNFLNKKDKIRGVISELLIKKLVSERLDNKMENIEFYKNEYGKPYIKNHPELKFNISHSGDFVICAIDTEPVGIDIEEIRQFEYKTIVKRYFSIEEFNYINKQEVDSSLNRFYEIWTLKESYIKCCGKGLSIPLKSFSIHIDKYKSIKVTIDGEKMKHIFKQFDIESGYKMAICSLNNEITNKIIFVEQKSLIN